MRPLALGSTIGILGEGQLGRMLALAAARLGFKICIFGPDRNAPAVQVCDNHIIAYFDDFEALRRLAKTCDIITFEWENIPVKSLEYLQTLGVRVAPGAEALSVTQDRLSEKIFAQTNDIKTTKFANIESTKAIVQALEVLGFPSLLKTRSEGYDGKGQVWIKTLDDVQTALEQIGHRPAILEAKADFIQEVSVIAARGYDGSIRTFPIGINIHKGGILDKTIAPSNLPPSLCDGAKDIATKVLKGLDYVGVLAVELFVMPDNTLWMNEIAPRVHNSGHWTQDGCICDQFEQHIRAVAGWPLGDTSAVAAVEMTNLLGEDISDHAVYAAQPGCKLHIYGKDTPRAGRKMGHINRLKPLLP